MAKKTASDDLAKEARELLEEDHQADKENRDEALRDLRFIAGDQWPSDVARERKLADRPTLTINRLPQFVNQVVNDFRVNAPGFSVVPVDNNTDPDLADIYNGMIRAIQYCSNANSVWASAFANSVQCGIGWFRVTTDYADSESFDQEIYIKRITNPLSVYCGPGIEPDRSDAQRIFVTEMVRKSVFKTRFPGAAETSFDVPDIGNFNGSSSFFWSTSDDIRIAEYWRKVEFKRKIVRLQDGKIVDLNDYAKFMGLAADDVKAMLPPVNAERTVDDHRVEHCLVSGSETLEKTTVWPGKYIPIIPVIGQEIPLGDKSMRYGLIRFARDPQQLYNFWRSAAAEAIALAPRAPYLVTPNMIGKFKNQWDSHHLKNRPYLLYEPDENAPGGRPIREMPPQVPQALVQESAIASDDMKATMGMYDASVGQRSNETSGKAINARKEEGDVATYHFRDNFNVSLTHCGRVVVDLIPKVYDTERVVRLMAEENEEPKFAAVNQQVMSEFGEPVLRHDLKAGKFDIRVKIGPSYTTRRQEAADSMVQFATAYPPTMQFAGDLIAKAMDWPDADKIAERLRKTIPPQVLGDDQEEPNPQQQQAMAMQQQLEQAIQQMQMERGQLENAKLKADVMQTAAGIEKTQVDSVQTAVETMIKAMQAMSPQPKPVAAPGKPQPANGRSPSPSGGGASRPSPSSGAPAVAPRPNPDAARGLIAQAVQFQSSFADSESL
jgi:hypothetical protein